MYKPQIFLCEKPANRVSYSLQRKKFKKTYKQFKNKLFEIKNKLEIHC